MPRIPDRMLESVFYLYPSLAAAEAGDKFGGCGFLITVPFERAKQNHLYAVTNRHVIDDGSLTLRIATQDRGLLLVDSDDRKWFRHPSGDDLAALLVDFPIGFQCTAMHYDLNQFVTRELTQQYDLGIGDEAFSVGRFVDHEGKLRHSPVVRFGNLAQMPDEPLKQGNGHLQESYLVEGRSVGGYSGAPVFIFIPPFAIRPGKNLAESKQHGPWLLGINWGHLVDWQPVCNAAGNPVAHGMRVAQNSGMMAVVPIWKLVEMIEHPQAMAERRAMEDVILGRENPARGD